MKTFVPFLVLIGLLMGSCQKKDGLTYTERRILGDWTYSKVKFTENWSVKTQDLTADYDQLTLTLRADFTALYTNAETGEVYEGLWELSENYSDDASVDNLFVSLQGGESNELRQLVFECVSVGTKKLRANYNTSDGCFRYVLE